MSRAIFREVYFFVDSGHDSIEALSELCWAGLVLVVLLFSLLNIFRPVFIVHLVQ